MTARSEVGFLLDDLCDRAPGVRFALAVSADGLVVAASRHIDRDVADTVGAGGSGLMAVTWSIVSLLGASAIEQICVDTPAGSAYVMTLEHGHVLAWTSPDADAAQVVYEMASTLSKVGDVLSSEPRHAVSA